MTSCCYPFSIDPFFQQRTPASRCIEVYIPCEGIVCSQSDAMKQKLHDKIVRIDNVIHGRCLSLTKKTRRNEPHGEQR
jgi:hypothetical protein